MSNPPTEEDVLDRGLLETILRWGPPCVVFGPADNKGIILYEDDHSRLLAHDAALRARIEALEAEREKYRQTVRHVEARLDSRQPELARQIINERHPEALEES